MHPFTPSKASYHTPATKENLCIPVFIAFTRQLEG
jgi:hypothetical protein